MENKETKSQEILEVLDFEEAISKNKKQYTKFKTDKGNFSVFEFDVIETLKKSKQDSDKVEVEIAENERGFRNIRKVIQVIKCETPLEKTSNITTTGAAAKSDNFTEARTLKNQSIYTSYAKDVFVEMLKTAENQLPTVQAINSQTDLGKEMMDRAIMFVKQAKEAFK